MKTISYTFINEGIIHNLVAGLSSNTKLSNGSSIMVQTYHYSIYQVINNEFKNDQKNCMDCKFSYNMNDGKSGGCYTHKGTMLMGLKSKLRSLHKQYKNGSILPFDNESFNKFYNKVAELDNIELVRFGAYGEPCLLPFDIVEKLAKLAKVNGYTHQWDKPEFNKYKAYFMASVHNIFEREIAKSLGFRSFIVKKENEILKGSFNCPASKEQNYKSNCIKCSLCGGNSSKSIKDVYILEH